jgi:hypothetical protein
VRPALPRTRSRWIAITVASVLVVAACSSGDDSEAKGSGGNGTTTTVAVPPIAPLTGLPDPTGVAQTRPVLSVKIENTPQVRPQAGIEAADVVWNEVVEGGITRFLAMYQSGSADVVGPIRSVRLTDPQIVWPVGGIFAYSGGAPNALDAIAAAPVTLVDENRADDAMFRDRSRSAPHNLFGSPDRLWAFDGEPVPPPPLFRYLAPNAKTPTATPAASASIGYGRGYAVGYSWDAALGAWLRSTDGRPFVTRTGSQLATQNVVILPVVYTGGVGQEGAKAQLVGSGDAIVLRNGTSTVATWERAEVGDRISLRTADGDRIRLVPGRTWVELPDVSYRVDVVKGAEAGAGT